MCRLPPAIVAALCVVVLGHSVSAMCVGDCDGSGKVDIDELLTGVNIALGTAPVDACAPLDRNGDGQVTIDELLAAVGAVLYGCPQFPTGAYFWPDHAYEQTGSALGDLAGFGLNTVVAYYEYVKPDVPPFSGQPDCHGLVHEAATYGIDFFIGAPQGRQVRTLAESELAQRLAATVECVGASPHYQGWMFDEPELTGYDPALLERVVGLLRVADPQHRIWVNFSPSATDGQVRSFAETANVIGFDIYPISDHNPQPLTAVGEYTRRARDVAAPAVPVWMIVQAFGYSDLPNEGGQGRRPLPHELRFMVYDALIHGARGVIFFGSHQLRNTIPLDAAVWSDGVAVVTRELAEIGPALLRCPLPPRVAAEPPALEAIRCAGSAGALVIAANTSDAPVDGVLTLVGDHGPVREVFEGRELGVAQGTLRDLFTAYQVHVYAVPP